MGSILLFSGILWSACSNSVWKEYNPVDIYLAVSPLISFMLEHLTNKKHICQNMPRNMFSMTKLGLQSTHTKIHFCFSYRPLSTMLCHTGPSIKIYIVLGEEDRVHASVFQCEISVSTWKICPLLLWNHLYAWGGRDCVEWQTVMWQVLCTWFRDTPLLTDITILYC